MTVAPGTATGTGVRLSLLGAAFRGAVPAPVVDQTGLEGLYDFTLTWAAVDPRRAPPSSLPDGPSIFTAVQEQLGMALEPMHQSRRAIIIDHIEKPTPD